MPTRRLVFVLDAEDEEGPVSPRQHGARSRGANILADLAQVGIVDSELEPCILAVLPEQAVEQGVGVVNQAAILFIPLYIRISCQAMLTTAAPQHGTCWKI